MTAAQRMLMGTALGRDVLSASETIQFHLNTYGRCDVRLWKDFLEKLHKGAGDEVMGSPLGLATQLAILGRIQGDSNGKDDASGAVGGPLVASLAGTSKRGGNLRERRANAQKAAHARRLRKWLLKQAWRADLRPPVM